MRDSRPKRSISVTIAGHPLTIKSDANEAYVQGLAKLVNDRVRAVQEAGKSVPMHAAALLAALQIADELAHERSGRAELRKRIRDKAQSLRQELRQELKA